MVSNEQLHQDDFQLQLLPSLDSDRFQIFSVVDSTCKSSFCHDKSNCTRHPTDSRQPTPTQNVIPQEFRQLTKEFYCKASLSSRHVMNANREALDTARDQTILNFLLRLSFFSLNLLRFSKSNSFGDSRDVGTLKLVPIGRLKTSRSTSGADRGLGKKEKTFSRAPDLIMREMFVSLVSEQSELHHRN